MHLFDRAYKSDLRPILQQLETLTEEVDAIRKARRAERGRWAGMVKRVTEIENVVEAAIGHLESNEGQDEAEDAEESDVSRETSPTQEDLRIALRRRM